ncbi:MAG: DoxX family protein [Bacteroidota bacterium]
MSALYILAGINHFVNPKFYLRIIPGWLPFHKAINYFSGLCEIIFAVLLWFENTKTTGAYLIIALLIAVFPANIKMYMDFKRKKHNYTWVTLIRLPLQFLLIWWAWIYTK